MIRLTHAQLQPIGLDIGTDSIKMLQLEVAGGGLAVRASALRRFADGAGSAMDFAVRMAMAGDMIRQMLRQGGFSGRRVVAALPREIVHIKNYRLPPMPASELEGAARLEATSLFSFDQEQATIQCIPAGEVRQGTETLQEVIVVAALNDEIETFVEQLHRCGLTVDSLDIEPCALYRSVERFIRRREDEQEVQVLADLGYAGSRVVIGKGREISFLKSIDIGARQFQQAVSQRLGITEAEASALRRRLGDSSAACRAPGADQAAAGVAQKSQVASQAQSADFRPLICESDPVRRAVFDAERGVMEQLGYELGLCLRYQAVTFRGCRPARLRLLGGEAGNANLHAILSAMLTIPVEVGRPLYSVDTSRMKLQERQGTMAEWALALGLGLRRTDQRFGPRNGKPREAGAECRPVSAEAGADSALNPQPSSLPVNSAHAEEVSHARA